MGATAMRTGPDEYTEGMGEVVKAYRTHTGLSTEAFARELRMNPRTYERIETGEPSTRDRAHGRTAQVPPGLFDSLEAVIHRFDRDVDTLINDLKQMGQREYIVFATLQGEWMRKVAGKASLYADIVPVLRRRGMGGRGQARTRAG
jgi:transcriptional regulator with XRE-family HTH domain